MEPRRQVPKVSKRQLRKRILRSIYDDSKPLLLSKVFQLDRPQHLTAALAALGRRGRWAEGLFVLALQAERRLSIGIAGYNAAADAALAAPAWRPAVQVLQAAVRQGVEGSLVTLGTAMKAQGMGGTWSHLLWTMADMLHRSLAPGIRHSNEAVKSCGADSWHISLCVLEWTTMRMVEVTEFTSSLLVNQLKQNWTLAVQLFGDLERQRLEHDTVSVNSVLNAASQQRRYSKNLLEQLKDADLVVDSATCSAVASTVDSEDVVQLLEMMKESSQQPDVGAYTSLLATLDRDGRWEAALDFWATTLTDGIQVAGSMTAALASACERGQQWAQAIHLLRLLKDHAVQLDLVMASTCLSAAAAGSWRRAWQDFCRMPQADVVPDISAHGAVISAAEKGQQWEMAIGSLRRCGVQPDLIALNAMVSACEKAQRWRWAYDLMSCMRQLLLQQDAISFNSSILACTSSRRWLQGLELVHLATQRHITPQVASFGALLMECEDASPSLLSCQEELLRGSLKAAGLEVPEKEMRCGTFSAERW